jgi:hypothetical protein
VASRRAKWLCIAGVAALAATAVLISVLFALIAPHPKKGVVKGQIVDRKGPIPHARIIVSFWDWHLNPIIDANPHDFGLEADETGSFHLTHDFDFRIGAIDVRACSPANELGFTRVQEPRDSNEPVIVTVGRRANSPERESYQYEYFRVHVYTIFKGRKWPPPPNSTYFDN